jgi:hypothetical protein
VGLEVEVLRPETREELGHHLLGREHGRAQHHLLRLGVAGNVADLALKHARS